MHDFMAGCFAWLKGRREPERAITLVIIGLDDAGKTTTIASIRGEPPDGVTPTVGFANKTLPICRRQVTVYDLGGGAKFRDVWKRYYAEIYGAIFVVDSCNKSRMEEGKNVLHEVVEHSRVAGKPILILANKQDKEGALTMEALDSLLEIKQLADKLKFQYNIMACSALKGYGRKLDPKIKLGLKWLVDTILKDMSNLGPRIDSDVAVQKEENEKEKQARMERIRKLREEREKREKEAGIEPDEESDDDVIASGKINPFQPIHKHLANVEQKQRKKKNKKAQKLEPSETELQDRKGEDESRESPVKKKKKKKKKVIQESESPEPEDVQEAAEDSGEVRIEKKKKKKKKVPVNNSMEDMGVSNDMADGEEQDVPKKKKKAKKAKGKASSREDLDEGSESRAIDEDSSYMNGTIDSVKSVDSSLNGPELRSSNEQVFSSEASLMSKQKKVRDAVGEEDSGSVDSCLKKKKTKKKRKKMNRTAPAPEESVENVLPPLPPPAWKTPPSSLNRLPALAPLRGELGSSLPPTRGPLKPIFGSEEEPRMTFAYGPNGDDNDVVT